MSTIFLIAPYERGAWIEANDRGEVLISDLKIDPDTYNQGVQKRWPLAIVEPVPSVCPYQIQWLLPTGREGFGGFCVSLWRNLQVVVFDTGPKEVFLDFVLWHRSFIPTIHRLFLFNLASSDCLELKSNTTAQDLIAFTGLLD